jgi:SAM-dependent methyltransferase
MTSIFNLRKKTYMSVIQPVAVMLEALEVVKKRPSQITDILHLNLGAGSSYFEGFQNLDQYPKGQAIQGDLVNPDFWAGTAATIYCSHALEHVGHTKSRQALVNWSKLLTPGGKLYLAVPDLQEICRQIGDPNTPYEYVWNWAVYTLFGYQTDTNTRPTTMEPGRSHPEDLGQYHLTGFTEAYLRKAMPAIGLEINSMFRYDGWGTPSIWLEATKY